MEINMITKTPLDTAQHAPLRGAGTVAIAAFAMTLQACGHGSNDFHPPSQTTYVAKTATEMCAALPNLSVPATEIGLPTADATITSAEIVLDAAKGNANGEYCKVLGSIHPVDKSAPDIKFEADLPTGWNGKLVHFGGGGADGVIPNTTSFATSGFSLMICCGKIRQKVM
jgi:feruloyl esterase